MGNFISGRDLFKANIQLTQARKSWNPLNRFTRGGVNSSSDINQALNIAPNV